MPEKKRAITCGCTVVLITDNLAIREDGAVVTLQDGLYERRTTYFIHSLLRGLVSEHRVEEEALRRLASVSTWIAYYDFPPVFLGLGDSVPDRVIPAKGENSDM